MAFLYEAKSATLRCQFYTRTYIEHRWAWELIYLVSSSIAELKAPWFLKTNMPFCLQSHFKCIINRITRRSRGFSIPRFHDLNQGFLCCQSANYKTQIWLLSIFSKCVRILCCYNSRGYVQTWTCFYTIVVFVALKSMCHVLFKKRLWSVFFGKLRAKKVFVAYCNLNLQLYVCHYSK